MPIFLDPRGKATYGIALCARCSRKMFIEDLYPDPNAPGLMVCVEDLDVLDPYRLPARQTEQINLPIYRPDLDLTDNLTFGQEFHSILICRYSTFSLNAWWITLVERL